MSITLENVSYGYQGKAVGQPISVSLDEGKVLCFLGPNGVGKTTLFKTMLNLLPIVSGEIQINGRDLNSFSRPEFANLVGYVPQSHATPFAFKAFDVVLMGCTAKMGPFASPSRKDREKAYIAMEKLEIQHLADKIFTELSGGEKQMVMIARALTQEPKFIMLDEPTASLDFGNQAKVLQQVKQLAANGLGIGMTTHAPDHAFLCESDVALLFRDQATLIGKATTVLTEENLSQAYGIPVAVLQNRWHEHCITNCSPII